MNDVLNIPISKIHVPQVRSSGHVNFIDTDEFLDPGNNFVDFIVDRRYNANTLVFQYPPSFVTFRVNSYRFPGMYMRIYHPYLIFCISCEISERYKIRLRGNSLTGNFLYFQNKPYESVDDVAYIPYMFNVSIYTEPEFSTLWLCVHRNSILSGSCEVRQLKSASLSDYIYNFILSSSYNDSSLKSEGRDGIETYIKRYGRDFPRELDGADKDFCESKMIEHTSKLSDFLKR